MDAPQQQQQSVAAAGGDGSSGSSGSGSGGGGGTGPPTATPSRRPSTLSVAVSESGGVRNSDAIPEEDGDVEGDLASSSTRKERKPAAGARTVWYEPGSEWERVAAAHATQLWKAIFDNNLDLVIKIVKKVR